jgi:nicotinate phosphoribosyltransferase
MLVVGDTVEAMLAFDAAVDPAVPRVCLIDTFQDEKFEALRVAAALGERLSAVRLDTPASRRGDMRRILQEVRWELDLRGFRHVRLFVSGGLSEADVAALRDAADGFGVGTALSGAPTVDFSMDIVEVDGVPLAKRGKDSGAKSPLRCPACGARKVVPLAREAVPCPRGCGAMAPLLLESVRGGKPLRAPRPPREIRADVLAQVGRFQTP